MVMLHLYKEYVDKHLEEWNKNAIKEFGDAAEGLYLFEDDTVGHIDEIEEDGKIHITCDNNELGIIATWVQLDTDDLIRLIEIAVKKMNKFKNILESLK